MCTAAPCRGRRPRGGFAAAHLGRPTRRAVVGVRALPGVCVAHSLRRLALGAAGIRAAPNKGARDWSCWALVATGRHRARHLCTAVVFWHCRLYQKEPRGSLRGKKPQRTTAEKPVLCSLERTREYRSAKYFSQRVPERGDPWEKARSTRGICKAAWQKADRSLPQCICKAAEVLCVSHKYRQNRLRAVRSLRVAHGRKQQP